MEEVTNDVSSWCTKVCPPCLCLVHRCSVSVLRGRQNEVAGAPKQEFRAWTPETGRDAACR